MSSRRICIDLDGVICQVRQSNQTYDQLEPVPGAREKMHALKEAGHYLIIHTARRMRTHSGNTGRVIADIGKLTLDWLAKYDIPYDEIMFGKPWADIYIDDNAFRFSSWGEIAGDAGNLPGSHELQVRGDW